MKKSKLKVVKSCGGKKCGSAFEWKVIDLTIQPKAKAA